MLPGQGGPRGSPWKALQSPGDVSRTAGQANGSGLRRLEQSVFQLFEPAHNCWRVCALVQLAPSSVHRAIVMLLVVPQPPHLGRGARSRWGSRSHRSPGALGWCTLVHSAMLLQNRPKHVPSTAQRRLSLKVRIPLITETKKMGAKGPMSSPESLRRPLVQWAKGEVLQVPRVEPFLRDWLQDLKLFGAGCWNRLLLGLWLEKTPDGQGSFQNGSLKVQLKPKSREAARRHLNKDSNTKGLVCFPRFFPPCSLQ